MQFIVGTSGYGYREWRGSFYPAKLKPAEMLAFYAERFPTVEINNTFYRMPDAETLSSWTREVPAAFRFAIKAPQTITHRKRLKNVAVETAEFFDALKGLKRRLGPILFQLPPNFKIDLSRLQTFLQCLGKRVPTTIEFRHPSWFIDDTYALLRRHRCALCVADGDDLPEAPLVATAKWGYVRLRRDDYRDSALRGWMTRLRKQPWERVYVYFKHDKVGHAARLAARWMALDC